MKITKMGPLVITNEDLSNIQKFYQDNFNFKLAFKHDAYLGLKAENNDKLELGFMSPMDEQPAYGGGGVSLCLEVDNPDAQHTRLVGNGVNVVRELQDNPWGDRSFVVVDPAGVSLYIYKRIPCSKEFEGCEKG